MTCVELHCHDEWSLLDGVGTAARGARRAAELGMPALAKTNHAVLSGVVHHIEACKDVGITPIIAVEAYYRERRVSKTQIDEMRKQGQNVEPFWEYFHMVLLAKNVRGWRSLKLLTSEAYRSGYYRYPCIDDELLDRWHDGLMISTSCISGYVPRALLRGDEEAADRHMDKLDRWVGDDWYFELQPHDFDDLRVVNQRLVLKAAERGKPIVATKDAHFPEPEWHETQRVSVMIRTKDTFSSQDQKRAEKGADWYDLTAPETCYIGGAEDTAGLFAKYHPRIPQQVVAESISNTIEIANRVTPFLLDRSPKIPKFYSDIERSNRELRRLVMEGLANLDHGDDPRYTDQADHELKILADKKFSDFFLITWDFVRWARSTDPLPATEEDPNPLPRERSMIVGVRGSAGGSTVAYALRISTINPITWSLRFERFLNKDREGLPDIDLDFPPGDADLVKEYLKRKWGRNKVYDMIAHGTLAAKGAISRISKVYDIPHKETVAVTKPIDKDDNESAIADLRETNNDLDRYFDRYPDVYKHAVRLQGQVGTIGEHAAAVVLSDRPMDELMPVMRKSVDDDQMVTAFGEAANTQIVSSLGFLKVDLLVVIELAKQAYAVELIKRIHGVDIKLDELPIEENPLDVDQRVMENFARGLFMGVFQFGGSAGISSTTKRFAPSNGLDLASLSAVYRPATLSKGVVKEYIERRLDPSKIVYWDPSVKSVLEETLGMLIYQEQVMDIFVQLGGFDPARADSVRKIMSKWYRAKGDIAEQKLGAHREDFVSSAAGILSGGRSAAENVWKFTGGFCEYSFNKSHAGQYGIHGYRDMLIKTFYPEIYYAAMMSFPPAKVKKPEERSLFYERGIREAKLLDVKVQPPDVNVSEESWTVAMDGLRFGLTSIKGLGPASIAELLELRPFTSWDDLEKRTVKCNSGHRAALGAAGALDRFGVRDDLTEEERLAGEELRLGVAISAPDQLRLIRDDLLPLINTVGEIEDMPHGAVVCVGGEIIGGKEIETRYGNKMARLFIAFGADEYVVSIKPKLWEHSQEKDAQGETVLASVKDLVATDRPLIVRGTKDEAYGSINADKVELAETIVGALAAA